MKSMYVILICIVHLRFIYSCGEEMDAESIISLRKYKLLSRASVRTIFCVLNVRLFFACVIFASRLESLARTTRQSNVSNMITVSTNRLVNWKFSRRQTPRDDLFSSFYSLSLSLSLSHTLFFLSFFYQRDVKDLDAIGHLSALVESTKPILFPSRSSIGLHVASSAFLRAFYARACRRREDFAGNK